MIAGYIITQNQKYLLLKHILVRRINLTHTEHDCDDKVEFAFI